MTKLTIDNRDEFIRDFLIPFSKLNDSVVLKVTKDSIYSLSSSSDGTLILYSTFNQVNDINDVLKLNIPDVSRLIKVLSCIADESITLNIEDNNISYRSSNVGFKYHLLEDGIISSPAVSVDKIKKLEFDLSFNVQQSNILSILKGSSFATDTDKIYFYTKDKKIYSKLTDFDRHNVDVYTQKLADEYEGVTIDTPIPLNFETIRTICSLRFISLKVNVNTDNKVFVFNISRDNIKLNFISTAYVS